MDERGHVIMPENAVIMRLFEILDYKWKVDPETGEERWLEVIRAVVDGSTDKRPENCYAESPDRTILLLMLSIGATTGEYAITSDAVRAYRLKGTGTRGGLVEVPCSEDEPLRWPPPSRRGQPLSPSRIPI